MKHYRRYETQIDYEQRMQDKRRDKGAILVWGMIGLVMMCLGIIVAIIIEAVRK